MLPVPVPIKKRQSATDPALKIFNKSKCKRLISLRCEEEDEKLRNKHSHDVIRKKIFFSASAEQSNENFSRNAIKNAKILHK